MIDAVGNHDVEVFGQGQDVLAPGSPELRPPVQQHQRHAGADAAPVYRVFTNGELSVITVGLRIEDRQHSQVDPVTCEYLHSIRLVFQVAPQHLRGLGPM